MFSRGSSLFARLGPAGAAGSGSPPYPPLHARSVACLLRLLSSVPAEAPSDVSVKAAASSVDKNALSRLRKKTGYSFINCRKALEKYAGDEVQAERWLREQAVKEGWSKALKLQSRPMSQGLIGVMTNNRLGVMVEVNCETDFVAKNAKFQQLVATITRACWLSASQRLAAVDGTVGLGGHQISLTGEEIMQLKVNAGQVLKDNIISEISGIGENMAARRAVAIAAVSEADHVGHYVHLTGASIEEPIKESGISLGKYAALVLVRPMSVTSETTPSASKDDVHNIARQIGQHVVGMKPTTLQESRDIQKSDTVVGSNSSSGCTLTAIHACGDNSTQAATEEESRALLNQEFLMDATVTVKEWLTDKQVDVISFARFEVGEDLVANVSGTEANGVAAAATA